MNEGVKGAKKLSDLNLKNVKQKDSTIIKLS